MNLRNALRLVFIPTMIALAGTAALLAARGASKVLVIGVIVLAIALSFAVERIIPYERGWNRSAGDSSRDVIHAVVNEGLLFASLVALPVVVAHLAIEGVWPSNLPYAAQLLMALLIVDLGLTLAHWASHHVGWLWRLHEVHHSVTRMYGFNGLMKHPLHQTVELTAGVGPLVLLGIPTEVAVGLAACVAIQLLLQHSNADYATGGADRWMAWNRPHRAHHIASKTEGDVNFGLFTTIWDRYLLRTAVDPTTHIGEGALGVAGRPDYPMPWHEQMVEPFRRRGSRPTQVGPPQPSARSEGS